MRKIFSVVVAMVLINVAIAQQKKDKRVLPESAGDHLMVQFTYDTWLGATDSISKRIKGFSRGLNIAFMLNKRFKSSPQWSVAFGLGGSSSNIFFKNTGIDLKSTSTKLPFKNLDSTDRFKKYKLATFFVEVPLELRYTANPEKENKSWKFAAGVKVGALFNAHTKGKTLQNRSGTTINSYIEKERKSSFFNGTRIVATARIGYGNFSLVGAYQITPLLKDVAGPPIKPLQIGICISGL
jgi:Outer membrane protein beta-barrel domain